MPADTETGDSGNVTSRKADTIADLIPGIETRGTHPSARFAVKPAGGIRQRLKSPGRMPEETRPYQAGDPVNLIDWRAYGRTDQLLLRLQQDQAPMDVNITIALHDSMNWPVPDIDFNRAQKDSMIETAGIKAKVELAWRVALFIGFALLRRGDTCRFNISDRFVWIPNSSRLVMDAFHWLSANQFGLVRGSVDRDILTDFFGTHLEDSLGAHNANSRSVIRTQGQRNILISDGLEPDEGLWHLRLAGLREDDLMVHLLSELEMTIDWYDSASVYTDGDPVNDPRRQFSLRGNWRKQTIEDPRRNFQNEWYQSWLVQQIPSARAQWLSGVDAVLDKNGVQLVRLTGTDRADVFTGMFESWYRGHHRYPKTGDSGGTGNKQ